MGGRREGRDGEGGREEKKMREAEVNSRAHEGRTERGRDRGEERGEEMRKGRSDTLQ